MKIVIISDTHFGARNNNQIIRKGITYFFENTFWPTIEERGITSIIHMGDLVDKNESIDFSVLDQMQHDFINQVFLSGVEDVRVIVGNHDTYFKSKNYPNASSLLLQTRQFSVYDTDPVLDEGILFVPWICRANRELCLEALENWNASTVIGHFEIEGFRMNAGAVCEKGFTLDHFSNFQDVFSGHFHTKSKQGNVQYLGSPYQTTWHDYGQRKGFHIFDTETRELEFIPNPIDLFHKFDHPDQIPEGLSDAFVRLIGDFPQTTINHLEAAGCDVISEPTDSQAVTVSSEVEIDAADTGESINAVIDDMEFEKVEKADVKHMMNELYTRAMQI